MQPMQGHREGRKAGPMTDDPLLVRAREKAKELGVLGRQAADLPLPLAERWPDGVDPRPGWLPTLWATRLEHLASICMYPDKAAAFRAEAEAIRRLNREQAV